MKFIRHGVVAMPAPRVAAQDAAYAEVEPLQCSMFRHCFHHILRASGGVAAGGRQEWGDGALIEAHGEDDETLQKIHILSVCGRGEDVAGTGTGVPTLRAATSVPWQQPAFLPFAASD